MIQRATFGGFSKKNVSQTAAGYYQRYVSGGAEELYLDWYALIHFARQAQIR
jgi:hypothetical protein